MFPLRVFLLFAAIVASSAVACGQTPSATPSRFTLEVQCDGQCPLMNAWSSAWQSFRAVCAGPRCSDACGKVAVGSPACCRSTGCATAAVGSVRCCEMVQAPAGCACAKACACCDKCQSKTDQKPQVQGMPELPAPSVVWMSGLESMAPPPLPPAHRVVQIQAIPAPPTVRVIECMPEAPALKAAHLVTPDFEAHCVRMTQRGDTILLEGDVLLLSKKHAQPIRIEAQRVLLNMRDGSFTVEPAPRSSVSNFGVMAPPYTPATRDSRFEAVYLTGGGMWRPTPSVQRIEYAPVFVTPPAIPR